jgi:hypothetical protein
MAGFWVVTEIYPVPPARNPPFMQQRRLALMVSGWRVVVMIKRFGCGRSVQVSVYTSCMVISVRSGQLDSAQ